MSLTSFVILATAIAGASAQGVMVNTPTSVVQCLPVQLSWTGGQPPYFLSLIPGGQPSGTPLADLGKQDGTSFSWKAELPVNTDVTVQIRDSAGVLNYSDKFTVQKPPSGVTCDNSGTSTGTASPPVTTGTSSAPAKNGSSSTTPTTPTTPTTGSTSGSPNGSTTGAMSGTNTTSTTPKTSTGTTTPVAGTNTPGSSASTDAKSDASRLSAGIMAVVVAAAVAVFA